LGGLLTKIGKTLAGCVPTALSAVVLMAALLVALAGCGAPSDNQLQTSAKSASAVLSGQHRAKPTSEAKGDAAAVAASSNAFAFDLFGAIRPEERNFVCSPYGVSVVLSMAMAGARGVTQQEFAQVLHLDLPEGTLFPALGALDVSLAGIKDLTSASSLWGQTGQPYEQSFVDLLGRTYGAPLRLVDFGDYRAAAESINQWVSEATNGRIQRSADPNGPRPDTIVLMLTNAVYMKAKWEKPFLHAQTSNSDFRLLSGAAVQGPIMNQLPEDLNYMSDSTLQAAELPYADGRLSFLVILPAEGQFVEVGRELSPQRLEQVLSAMETRTVALALPRFTFSSSSDLVDALQRLGLKAAFSSGADFSGMSTVRSQISGVAEEAFVLVDEAGTEAAAGATITMSAGVPPDEVFMAVDRPFYYLIRDKQTGVILFMGQVTDPSGEEQS
jgi:serpin B